MIDTLLAGDIGGTKTILRLAKSPSPTTDSALTQPPTIYEQTFRSKSFPDLVPMVRQFLKAATAELGQAIAIQYACFGVAGPVVDNRSELTNLGWSLSRERLATQLEIPRVRLINDFEAIGHGILGLGSSDLACLQDVPANPDGAIAYLGAGTGLGQGYLIPRPPHGYRVFPSEGAHADFAPRSHQEFQLLNYLKERHQLTRISVERVVSGTGIASIYEFLRDRYPSQESSSMATIHQTWQQEMGKSEKTIDLSAEISRAALEQDDYLCGQALELFVEAYGAEAGNLALKLLPYGGLYVAGGVAPKILSLLEKGSFMTAFRHKGRMSQLMTEIPVNIVLNPKVGLIGATRYAAQCVINE